MLQLVNKLNEEEIGEEERDTLLKLGPIIGNFIKSCLKNCRLESKLSDLVDGFKDVKIMVEDPRFKSSLVQHLEIED